MKKLKNNGFTLVELLAVLVILSIITTIAVASYYGLFDKTKEKVYKSYEDGMKDAAMIYIMNEDAPTATNPLRLSLKYLVGEMDNGKKAKKPYIDYFENPDDSSDKCLNSSYVEVSLVPKDNIDDGKIDNNVKYEYKVCLICNKYRTEGC